MNRKRPPAAALARATTIILAGADRATSSWLSAQLAAGRTACSAYAEMEASGPAVEAIIAAAIADVAALLSPAARATRWPPTVRKAFAAAKARTAVLKFEVIALRAGLRHGQPLMPFAIAESLLGAAARQIEEALHIDLLYQCVPDAVIRVSMQAAGHRLVARRRELAAYGRRLRGIRP